MQPAVQAVAVLIGGYVYDFFVQGELRPADAVGKAPHGGTHAVAVQLVIGGGVIAQCHVHGAAAAVRHHNAVDDGTVVQDMYLDKVVFQHGDLDGLAVGGFAEIADQNRH